MEEHISINRSNHAHLSLLQIRVNSTHDREKTLGLWLVFLISFIRVILRISKMPSFLLSTVGALLMYRAYFVYSLDDEFGDECT